MKIDLSELVSQKQAADIRGVSVQAIHKLIKRGRLTPIEVGGKLFLLRKEVEAFRPTITGRPRKDSTAAKSSQSSKPAKSAKKKRSR